MNTTDEKIYYVASVIKFLSRINIDAAAAVAKNLKKLYDDDVDELNNKIIYNAYVEKVGGVLPYVK